MGSDMGSRKGEAILPAVLKRKSIHELEMLELLISERTYLLHASQCFNCSASTVNLIDDV